METSASSSTGSDSCRSRPDPAGAQATVLGGLSYGIFRQSPRSDLALSLLDRAFRPEVLRVFCAQTGQNPPTISATRALEAETEPFLHATAQFFKYARSPLADRRVRPGLGPDRAHVRKRDHRRSHAR